MVLSPPLFVAMALQFTPSIMKSFAGWIVHNFAKDNRVEAVENLRIIKALPDAVFENSDFCNQTCARCKHAIGPFGFEDPKQPSLLCKPCVDAAGGIDVGDSLKMLRLWSDR